MSPLKLSKLLPQVRLCRNCASIGKSDLVRQSRERRDGSTQSDEILSCCDSRSGHLTLYTEMVGSTLSVVGNAVSDELGVRQCFDRCYQILDLPATLGCPRAQMRRLRERTKQGDNAYAEVERLTMTLSNAGRRRHATEAVYQDHRLPPRLAGAAARDRSNRLLDGNLNVVDAARRRGNRRAILTHSVEVKSYRFAYGLLGGGNGFPCRDAAGKIRDIC